MYKIEKDVPISHRPKAPRAPFAEMEIGDSFFVPLAQGIAVRSSASSYGRRKGQRFACHRACENGVEGFRIWRLQ